MITTSRRLTKHQAKVLARIQHLARSTGRGYGLSKDIGSRGACRHLEEKRYITADEIHGPNGGTTWRYWITADGATVLSP